MKLPLISCSLFALSLKTCFAVTDASGIKIGVEYIDQVVKSVLTTYKETGSFYAPRYKFSVNEEFNMHELPFLDENSIKTAILKGMEEDRIEKEYFNDIDDNFYKRVYEIFKISHMLKDYDTIITLKLQNNIRLLNEYMKMKETNLEKADIATFLINPKEGIQKAQDLLKDEYFDIAILNKSEDEYTSLADINGFDKDAYERFFYRLSLYSPTEYAYLVAAFDLEDKELKNIPGFLKDLGKWNAIFPPILQPSAGPTFPPVSYFFIKAVCLKDAGVKDQKDKHRITELDADIAERTQNEILKNVDYFAEDISLSPRFENGLSEELLKPYEFLNDSARSDIVVKYDPFNRMNSKDIRRILIGNGILNKEVLEIPYIYDFEVSKILGINRSKKKSGDSLKVVFGVLAVIVVALSVGGYFYYKL